MSLGGTSMYQQLEPATVPELVQKAVQAAQELSFELCVHPATGRLLQSLAAGIAPGGVVGESGTGTGAGLAWMVSMADPKVSFISAEIDAERASAAQKVFANHANVTVLHGDSGLVYERGPFDLLVFDGGWGSGKAGDPVVGLDVVKPHGVLTVDDLAPMTEFPPTYAGKVDNGRYNWLRHEDVLATEIQVAPDMAVLVARHTPGARQSD